MKRKMRVIAAAAMAAVMIAMTGCGSSAETEETTAETTGDGTYTVGIIQQLEHAALDEATKGFQDTLTEKLGDKVTFDYQNAQNEQANCATIATKFVSNNVDLIMANATTALQASAAATGDIPIVGTSVTDYVTAGVIESNDAPGYNVTGASDLAPVDQQIALLQKIVPDVQKVAIVYCSAEPNSQFQSHWTKPASHGKNLQQLTPTKYRRLSQTPSQTATQYIFLQTTPWQITWKSSKT